MRTKHDSDFDLIARVQTGEEASARELVERHTGQMLAVARRFLDDEDDARDAVQDAFASAFAAIDRFRGDAALGTWLHRIVVNAALKRVRAARRRPETELDDLMPVFDHEDERVESLLGPAPRADRLLEQREIRERVREAIAHLPEDHRAAILLRDIEGRTTKDAAAALDVSPCALKVRLHRARAALKRLLEPVLEGELQ